MAEYSKNDTTKQPDDAPPDEMDVEHVKDEAKDFTIGEDDGPGEFTYDPDSVVNLAPVFGDHPDGLLALKKIAEHVKDNFDAAHKAASDEITRLEEDIAVFLGKLPEKEPAFENAAKAHLPLMLKTLTRLEARISGELFGDWKNFVTVLPTSPGEDEQVAAALTKHTNWQLANQIPDFQRQCERAVLWFFLYGDITCQSSYDTVRKQNRHEMLNPGEFICPMVNSTTMPDYSDVPYYARIMMMYEQDLEQRRDIWFDVDRVLEHREPSWDDEPETKLPLEAAKESGIVPADAKDALPFKVIWYEGWVELPPTAPDQPEQTRWCKVLFDFESSAVFELSVHEQVNWQDAQRYDKQMQELMAYRQATQQHIAEMTQMQDQLQKLGPMVDAAQTGLLPPEQQQMVGQQFQQLQQGVQKPAPPPPPWAKDGDPQDPSYAPEKPRKEPIRLFSHAVCIEPPAGPRGVSFGRIEADFNRGADTVTSQFIDSATLANTPPLMAKAGTEFVEKVRLTPGKLLHIEGFDGSDIREAVAVVQIPQANPQLVTLAQMFSEWSEEAIQAPGVLVGEPGKSGETARGYGMRVEQATKSLTASARRLARFFTEVIKKNAALNARFLSDEELFAVQDPDTAQWQGMKIGRKLYERNYLVEFRTDMTFTSRAQKVQEADSVLQLLQAIPQLQQNIPLMQYAVGKALKARGFNDYANFLGPQAPPPQTPLGLPPPPPPGAQPQAQPPHQQPGAVPPGQSPAPGPKGQPSPPSPKAPAQQPMA